MSTLTVEMLNDTMKVSKVNGIVQITENCDVNGSGRRAWGRNMSEFDWRN